ncbi:MAG: cadherin repeat domain-containing protein [Gammaproteobacteria bacterium]|nr:cadherin repeat domain-containing protein [Gammaproteobacteria bacterium]
MDIPQSNDLRLKLSGLVKFIPVIALACYAAFAAVPINAQITDNCGWDSDDDGDFDAQDDDNPTKDIEFFVGDSNSTDSLLEFVASGCAQSGTVQLRIYEGHEVGQPSSHIRLPETGDLNLGPDSDPDSVTLVIDGTHPNRTIGLNEATLNWDSTSAAWLIAPIKYTVRALSIESDNLGELKITVIVHPGRLTAPTAIMAASESPENIYVEWVGLADSDTAGGYGSPLAYQVRWIPVDDSSSVFISDPIDDNDVAATRGHDYTISGLAAAKQYNISVRSYKKRPGGNQYDFQVSDWLDFDSTSDPTLTTTKALYDTTAPVNDLQDSLEPLTAGHTRQYLLNRWIVPSSDLRPTGTTYTVDVDSGNDAVFTAEHILAGTGIADDLIIVKGVGEGEANLSIEVTTSGGHVLNATMKVTIRENAAPVFTVTSVSIDWDIENVGTEFEIDITNQFVSGEIDEDDADNLEYSMTGGSYRGRTYLEIDDETGDISVPDAVDDDDLDRLSNGHEFELEVTVTDPADQSDKMTVYVEVIKGGVADTPLRTANSDDEVWLVPLASANGGGTKRTDVSGSFSTPAGGQLCFEIDDTGFTVDGTDQTTNITINNNSIDVATVADFSLSGANSCPRGQLSVQMELPSTDSSSDQFALLGYHGVITVWADVTAYQRGNSASASTDPVRVRIDLVYGSNAAPIIRSVAKVTGGNTFYTSSAYSIDEGDDINLTFTADDPSPTGDRLCWSQRNNCTPCKGAEDNEVYNAARGGVVTEKRASDTVSNVSHEYELTVRGTETGIFGSNVPRVNTDYESNPGGYEINLCATDLAGKSHKVKFVVRIENVEEAPVIKTIANMYFLVGDYAQEIDLNDLTVDGDGASDIVDFDAEIVGSSNAVTVEESNGIVTVTPTDDDVSGTQEVEIEVTATDSSGATAYQTFFAYVRNSNNSPSFAGGASAVSYNLEENAAVGTNVGTPHEATDPDGDTISYELSGGKDYFRVVSTDDGGQIKVKKKGLDYESDDNVFKLVLTASDSYGSAVALNITITLTDVNEPPMATPDVIPDQTILVGVTECIIKGSEHFVDPDADDDTPALTFSAASTRPGEVSVEVENNDDICITGESVGSRPARITVTATDSDGTTVFKRFRATAQQNNPPTVVGDGLPDIEVQFDGRSDDIDLNDYFNDGDAGYDEELSYGFSVDDADIVTAVVRHDHYLRIYGDEAGETNIKVTATDQNNQSVSDTFAVEVVRNDPPIPHPDAIADVTTRIGLTVDPIDASGAFTDEGDTFDLDIKTDDADIATAAIDYDDDDNPWIDIYLHSTGVTKATLKATDTAGNSAEVSFTIDVGARNDPPKLVNEIDDQTVEVDDRIDVELDDVFEDEGELSYEIDNEDDDVADVIYRSSSNALRIWGNKVGTTEVTVTVFDNLDQSVSDTFTVTVTDPPPANSAPNLVAQIDDLTVTVGMPGLVSITGNFSDPDGDELAYIVESDDPNVVTASLNEMEITLTGLIAGNATVRVIATDPAGLDVVDVFKVYVETAPQIASQIADVTLQIGGDSVSLNVAEYFVDDDGDMLAYSFNFEGNAAITNVDGTSLSLMPSVLGTTVVTVTATDTAGRSASQSFKTFVSNSEIKEVGTEALSSVGRQIISSVANAIGTRVENKDSENNLFSRVIGGKSKEDERAIADTPAQPQTPGPAPKVEPVFETPTTAKAPTTKRSRDVFSDVISPRNFTSMRLRDLIPQNFSTSLTGANSRFKLSIWGTTDQQDSSSSMYETSSSSTYLGVDIRPLQNLMIGISLSENSAESDYSWGTAVRQLQTDTTTILPYASLQVTPSTLVWGTVGVGSGDASIWSGENLVDESTLSLRLGHIAIKSHIVQMHGIDLAVKGDVSVANLATSNGVGEASGLDTTIDRARVGVAGSYAMPLEWGGSFTPFGELAYRRDGGDGATGSGVEFIGGLRVASTMFSLDLRGHTMATYSENDYKESGVSLLAVFNPTPGEEGLSLSFTPSWGQSARTDATLWRESATVGQLPFGGGQGLSQGMTFNTNISYGFLINQDQHMFKPYVEFGENALDLQTILFGAELKPLVLDKSLLNLNFVLGKVDELSKKDNKHLGVNAILKF